MSHAQKQDTILKKKIEEHKQLLDDNNRLKDSHKNHIKQQRTSGAFSEMSEFSNKNEEQTNTKLPNIGKGLDKAALTAQNFTDTD